MIAAPFTKRRPSPVRTIAPGVLALAFTLPLFAQTDAQAPAAPKQVEPAAAPTAPADEFELLEAGEEPQIRRFAYRTGQTSIWRMVNDTEMKTDFGVGLQGEPLPTTEQYIKLRVLDVDDAGVASLRATFERARVVPGQELDPFVADAVEQGLASFRGLRLNYKIDACGHGSDEVVVGPDGAPLADQAIRQSMEETMSASGVPLPAEPFGVGAVWVERRTVTINGVTMRRESTHTVEAIDGDDITVVSKVEVFTKPHFVENANLTPGVRVRLDSTSLKGGGRSVFSLSAPESSFEVSISGDIHMTVFQNGQELPLHQWMSMAMTAEPHEGPLPDAPGASDDGPAF